MTTPARPSGETKKKGSLFVNYLVASVLVGVGIWIVAIEAKTPPIHTTHLAIGVGLIVLGAGIARPDPIIVFVKGIFITLGDTNLPLVGGRRKDDQPTTPPSAP